MRKIVGLTGKAGAGKDTVASFLAGFGFKRIAFADALYEEVSQAYGVSENLLKFRDTKETAMPELALERCVDKDFALIAAFTFYKEDDAKGISPAETPLVPRSPRRILQVWGTEYRRKQLGASVTHRVAPNDRYWRDKVTKLIRDEPKQNFVITDVRFPDEAQDLMALGGKIVRVILEDASGFVKPRTASANHPSEVAMDAFPVATKLYNRKDTAGLINLMSQTTNEIIYNKARLWGG